MDFEQAQAEGQLVNSKYSRTVPLKSIVGQDDGGLEFIGQSVVVGGWVKTSREYRKRDPASAEPQKQVPAGEPKEGTCLHLPSPSPCLRSIRKVFGQQNRDKSVFDKPPTPPPPSIVVLEISDGSCISNLQVIVDSSQASPGKIMPVGTCIMVEGMLQLSSLRQEKQRIELRADKILHYGGVDQVKYPISRKRMNLNLLRDSLHFRHRKKKVARVMVIRDALAQATHTFFQDQNHFLYVEAPIITSTDCEGVGKSEMFQVTTLSVKGLTRSQSTTEELKTVVEEARSKAEEKKKKLHDPDSSSKDAVQVFRELDQDTVLVSQLEAPSFARSDEKYRLSKYFFSCETFLTVSGGPHLESYACAFGNVYSFGPRFRAILDESNKLLSEAWMVEVEMAFVEAEGAMDCAKDFLMFICESILEDSVKDINFISEKRDEGGSQPNYNAESKDEIVDRLRLIAHHGKFEKISYNDAVNLLMTNEKFEGEVKWGYPLSEEHESYLTDEKYKKPVIIYNHPKDTKPFYMRENDDGKTVASFDVIVPKVGTLIRGSQNEERVDTLDKRMKDLNLAKEQYQWYLDLRRHGSAKCSGFTVLFDALVLFATGLDDARDVVPFPRSPGKANT